MERKTRRVTALKEKNTKQDQDKRRKSLQTLQPSADSISVLVGLSGTVTKDLDDKGQNKSKGKDFFSKKTLKENREQNFSTNQYVSKENSPMRLRHSSRKTSVKGAGPKKPNNKKLVTVIKEQDLHSDVPVTPKQGNTLSKWITKKPVMKLKDSTKIEQNITENIKLVSSISSLEKIESSGSSEVFEEKSVTHDVKKRKVSTEESQIDKNSKISKKTKIESSVSSNEFCREFSVSSEVYNSLINDEVPDTYWKELAEQRRVALDTSLRENEMLHEQVEVLEARLQKMERENEELISIAKGQVKSKGKDIELLYGKTLSKNYEVNTDNNQCLPKDNSPIKLRHSNRKTSTKDVGPKTLRNKKLSETINEQLPGKILAVSKEENLTLNKVVSAKPVTKSNYSNDENSKKLHNTAGNVELILSVAPNSENVESSGIPSKTLDESEKAIDNDEVPDTHWKILVEKTLHEYEMLQDQIEVLETENAHLRNIAKEAEGLAVTVKCGKTAISNFLAEATESSSGDYHPTQGVRILEFESDSLNVTGRIVKAEVELWDCSGDTKFENCWPALMKDANGVIFVYSSDPLNVEKEMDMWYANFVQAQGLKDSQCVVFCHQKPGRSEGRSSQLSSLFARVTWVQTNIEESGNQLRREFNSFLQRLLSNISERRDQEELSIINQH